MSKKSLAWWWLLDSKALPDTREELIQSAEILHSQAHKFAARATVLGALVGAVAGILVLWFFEAMTRSGNPMSWPRMIVWVVCIFLGAGTGLNFARGRANRLRSFAAIALSLARIEGQLAQSPRGMDSNLAETDPDPRARGNQ